MTVPILSIERRAAVCPATVATVAFAVAFVIVPVSAPAQQPSMSRDELIRKWDLDRDGKISDGEAEVARSRMRRARSTTDLGGGTDPLTGRPRAGGDAPRAAEPAIRPQLGASPAIPPGDADGLILVPGTGDRGGRPLGIVGEPPPTPRIVGEPPSTPRSVGDPAPTPRREREPLSGNRAPTAAPPMPQASARSSLPGPAAPSRPGSGLSSGRDDRAAGRDERAPGMGRELTSRARVLPGGPQPIEGTRQQPVSPRPGVIAGGAAAGSPRASLPAVRPGYGAAGPHDLNAGRLPGGLPPARGISSGPPAASRMGPGTGSGVGSGVGPAGPAMPGRGPLSGLSGPRSAMSVPPPLPPPPRPGGASSVPRSTTSPRVPRPAPENVYGR